MRRGEKDMRARAIAYGVAAVLTTVMLAPAGVSSAALPAGSLFAFGENIVGELGSTTNNATSNPNPTPTLVNLPGATGSVTEIAAGYQHSLAATSSGQLYSFGDNDLGELGIATNSGTSNPNPTPALVTLPGESGTVTRVSAGYEFSLAATSSGQLYAFGWNAYGQLGNETNLGKVTPNPTPTLVTLPGESGTVTDISAGDNFALAVTSSGQLYAFGDNESGQLGNSTNIETHNANPTPTLVSLPGESGGVIQAVAGSDFSLAVTASGQLYAFGENNYGQLGSATNNATNVPNPTPTLVTLPGESGTVTQVAAGGEFSLAVTSGDQLYSFGNNGSGQLGNSTNSGTSTPNPTPTLVSLPGEKGTVSDVAAGAGYSLLSTSTAQLYSFGDNRYGELGRSTNSGTSTPNPTPALVSMPAEGEAVAEIAAGRVHSLVIASGAVSEPPPSPPTAGAPSLSTVYVPGQTLTCDPNATGWTGEPTFTYQWLRDGTAIPGATDDEYAITEDDSGHTLACRVTGTNVAGSASAVTDTVHVGTARTTSGSGSTSGAGSTPPAGSTLAGAPALGAGPMVLASLEARSTAGAPVTIDLALSSPNGGSPIAGYETTFHTPAGTFAADCSAGSPYVTATFSGAAAVTAVVTATSQSGASSTTTIPFTVSSLPGRAHTAAVTGASSVMSSVCSSSAPPAQSSGGAPSASAIPKENICRAFTFAFRIDSGLVDAESEHGCYVEGDSSVVPAAEWAQLKDKLFGVQDASEISKLQDGVAETASAHQAQAGDPSTDTFYVFEGPVMVNGIDIEPAKGASVVLAVGGADTSFTHQNAAYLVSSNATMYLPLPLPGGSTIKVPLNWSGGTLSEALNGGGGDFADSTLQQAMSGHAPGVTPPLPGGPVDINVSSIEYVNDPETGDVVPRPHSSVVVTKFDIASALNEVKPAGLPFTLTGTAQPSFDIAANGTPETTVAKLQLGVPGIVGPDGADLTGAVQVHADNAHGGAYLDCLGVGVNSSEPASLGGIQLKDLDVTYYGAKGLDTPGCVGTPPPEAAGHAASSLVVNGDALLLDGELTGRFELDTGKHAPGASSWNGTLAYDSPSGLDLTPGSPVPVFLGSAAFQLDDSSITGTANLFAASPGLGGQGCGLLGYTGNVKIQWSPNFLIAGTGQTTVMCAPFGSNDGFLVEEANNASGQPLVTVGIEHGESFALPGVLSVSGSGAAAVQLNLDTLNPTFEADLNGNASLNIPSISISGISTPSLSFSGNAQLVDSNVGLSACLKIDEVLEVGAGFHYLGLVDGIITTTTAVLNPPLGAVLIGARMLIGNEIDIGGCNVGPYRTLDLSKLPGLDGSTSSVHATTATTGGATIEVARGERQLVLVAKGQSAAPAPTLTSPDGKTKIDASVPSGLYKTFLIIHQGNRTEIDVADPTPGRWSVGVAGGSAPITSLASSQVLGTPSARGTVRAAARGAESLHYKLANVFAGTKLEFSEQAADGASFPIGTARANARGSGTLRFAPAMLGPGRRTITLITTVPGASPSQPLTVTRYNAPALAIGRPKHLRARRAGSAVVVSFLPAANAVNGDVVELQLGDGSERTVTAARGKRSVRIAGVGKLGVVAVTVRGVRGFTYGPLAGLIARSRAKHKHRRG